MEIVVAVWLCCRVVVDLMGVMRVPWKVEVLRFEEREELSVVVAMAAILKEGLMRD